MKNKGGGGGAGEGNHFWMHAILGLEHLYWITSFLKSLEQTHAISKATKVNKSRYDIFYNCHEKDVYQEDSYP